MTHSALSLAGSSARRFVPILMVVCAPFTAHGGWEVFSIPTDHQSERILDFSFIDEMRGWALISDGFNSRVVRTVDGGETWEPTYSNNFDGSNLSTLQFVNENVGFYSTGDLFDSETLFRTLDGGMTFDPVGVPFDHQFFPADVASIFFFDELNGWAAGDFRDGMFSRTASGGTSWNVRPVQRAFEANDLFFFNPARGWAIGGGSLATDGIILFTHDGGENWQVGRTLTQDKLFAVRFVNEQLGWAVGRNGSIHVSIDGGKFWYPQDSRTTSELTDVRAFDENIVVAAVNDFSNPGRILLTTNGGAFWRESRLPERVVAQTLESVGDTLWAGGSVLSSNPTSIVLFRQRIDPANFPGIVVDALPGGTVGMLYEFPLNAVNGTPPYAWTLIGEANGLTLDSQTGLVSGVPLQPGNTELRIRLTDANSNTDERTLAISIIDTPLSLASSTLPSVTHRTTFRVALDVVGGHKPYHFRLSGANPPPGVSVDPQGVLAGTPFEVGTFNFIVEVVDSGSLPQRAAAEFSLQVNPLLSEKWEVQHANNRITGIHFFDENRGLAVGWSGLVLDTEDGGRTWNRTELGRTELIDLECAGDDCWILANGSRVFRSNDWGHAWEETAPVGISSAYGFRFFDNQRGWTHGNGIYYTEDGGESWHAASTPAGDYYFALDFRDTMNGYAGGDNAALARSTDGGKTWVRESIPGFPGKYQFNPNALNQPSLKLDGKSGTILEKGGGSPQIQGIYFLNSQEGWIGTNVGGNNFDTRILHTVNGGQSWAFQGAQGIGNTGLFQFLPNGQTGWTCGIFGGNLRKTANGGSTWSLQTDFGGDNHFFDIQFLDSNTGWACANLTGRFVGNGIVDMEGSIWKTTDGGLTWSLQYGWSPGFDQFAEDAPENLVTGPDFQDVSFPSEKVGYALGRRVYQGLESFLYRTDSGGAFWTQRGNPPFFFYRIDFPNEWHGFGLSEDGMQPVHETVDGGRTWFPRHDIGESGTIAATESVRDIGFTGYWSDVFFVDDLHGWIFRDRKTFDENLRNVLRTKDGGKTWEGFDLGPGTGSHRLFFADPLNGWLVSDQGTIEMTEDGGETWTTQLPFGTPFPRFAGTHFVDDTVGFAVGTAGLIAETTTGGEIWALRQSDPLVDLKAVSFVTCLRGWIVGRRGFDLVHPLVYETRTGSFKDLTEVDFGLRNHPLLVIESPDTVNAWVLGRYGAGLKYSAPTDAVRITTESLPPGRHGTAYNLQLQSENGTGPFQWRLCGGRLPEGMNLSSQGVLGGAPTEAGSFRITPAVFDSNNESAGRRLLLTVEPAVSPTILTQDLPPGIVGIPYYAALEASGTEDPYEWTLAEGDLPPGINLLPYGIVSGIPTIPGAFPITLRVVDGQTPPGSASRQYTLNITGKFASETGSPCEGPSLLCIARTWYQSGLGLPGDLNGSGAVDAEDILFFLETGAR